MPGGTLIVNQVNPYLGYGYRLYNWYTFSAALDGQFGASNVTVSNAAMDNLAALLVYDSLMVVPRQPGVGNALSGTEISVLTAYIATGRRVLLVGENDAWTDWNNSILASVGGSFAGEYSGYSAAVLTHPLTDGVSQVYFASDGVASGGASLFAANVATLWGGGQNVLSLLSVNALDDGYWTYGDNAQFGANVAAWLASGGEVVVPEPSTFALFGAGILLLGVRRYARRS